MGGFILDLRFPGSSDVMTEFSPFYDRLLVSCSQAEEPSAPTEALQAKASPEMDAIG